MNLITLGKSVLIFLAVLQETVCLNKKGLVWFPRKQDILHLTRLIFTTGICSEVSGHIHLSKEIVHICPKYLTILERTSSIATQINTKDRHMAPAPKVVSTYDVAWHVSDVLVESKTSSGIFSLTAKAQGSSIAKRKPRTVVLPTLYIGIDISGI